MQTRWTGIWHLRAGNGSGPVLPSTPTLCGITEVVSWDFVDVLVDDSEYMIDHVKRSMPRACETCLELAPIALL